MSSIIEQFNSSLKGPIDEDDYDHAMNVWKTFNCKTLRDYWFLYLRSDVLLLADVFENFRSLSLKEYKLDPCHYYSAPGLSWDACLKLTKAKIPTLFDRDIHDMIQSGIRGGVSVISHRYAKANNQQVPDYDPKIAPNNLVYIDANNLYGFSMSQDLPCDEFEWHEDKCWNSLEHKFKCTNGYGYILEVDLEYPDRSA